MNKEHFELRPRKGYGLINFGMTIEDVEKLSDIYGKVKSGGPLHTEESWARLIEFLRSTGMPEEEIAEQERFFKEDELGRQAIEEKKKTSRYNLEKDITCFFYEGKLYEIRVIGETLPVYFAGQNLYDLPGEAAIRLVAETLQENPYLKEKGAFFVKGRFVLGDFYSEIRNGDPVWTPPHQKTERCLFMSNTGKDKANYDLEEAVLFKAI